MMHEKGQKMKKQNKNKVVQTVLIMELIIILVSIVGLIYFDSLSENSPHYILIQNILYFVLILCFVLGGFFLFLLLKVGTPLYNKKNVTKLAKKRQDSINPFPPLKPMSWQEIIAAYQDEGLNGYDFEVEKVIYGKDESRRAIIIKRKDSYEIRYEQLFPFEEDEMRYTSRHAYWGPVDLGKTIVDTIANAEKIISEEHFL
jgi:hypothetical protein